VIPLSFGSTAELLRASWAAVDTPHEVGDAAWRRHVAVWLCHELRIEPDRVVVELLDEVLLYAQQTAEEDEEDVYPVSLTAERGGYRPRGSA
jgi:hypothetical protein